MTRQEVIYNAVQHWFRIAAKPERVPTAIEITFLSGLSRVFKREVKIAFNQINRRN